MKITKQIGLILQLQILFHVRQQIVHRSMTDNKQQEMKEEINANLAKKDYYDILRVPKTASDTDIKKAYRTLALKFHPDKNSAEGSKQVFKKVSHAYSVLIDAEKKQHYDQFGPEQDQPRPTNRRRHHQDDFEFNEYDDIFRAFFGGAAQQAQRGGNFRTYSYSFGGNQGNQRNQGQAQQQQRGGINFSLVFIILFLVYTLAPLFKSSPSYSSIPSSDHKFNMKTSLLHVDFYVSQSYFQESSNPQFKKQAEMIIDREYLVDLQKKCQGKKKEKKRLQETAYRESPGVRRENYLGQAKRVDLITCRTITDLNEQHEDYVRDLTYMK